MSDGAWGRVERLLPQVERPARYIDSEWNARHDGDPSYRVALVYPDAYEIGMANQAIGILYDRLNGLEDTVAERAYVPWTDMSRLMRDRGVELCTLESTTPLRSCDLIGITLPYELTYTNVLETLDLAGIPLRSTDRDERHPLVIGGGPCAFNPEPVAPFFDAVLIGEGEEAIEQIVEFHRQARESGAGCGELLTGLAAIDGVYVPSLYTAIGEATDLEAGMAPTRGAPPVVSKRVVETLTRHRTPVCPVVPFMDVVHDRATVEVLRGCTRGCRFCQAGMVYRPVRERDADSIIRDVMEELACTGYDEVSLTSLSTTDHSQIEEVVRRLTRRLEGTGISVSLPSLRVDAFSVAMARLVGSGRKSGLTFAPEAGSQRLRDVINKNVTEEDLLATVTAAFTSGWRRVKLYFMIGLPTELDEDLVAIGDLVTTVHATARAATPPAQRGSLRVAVSISTFVPKAHTPFQFVGQISEDEIRRRQQVVREAMPRKGVDVSWHDADVSFIEAVMARGGRAIADVIEAAWRGGARFDAWTDLFQRRVWDEAFEVTGVDGAAVATRGFSAGDSIPWAHISSGVSEAYLRREFERALAGETTGDCRFDVCTGCGVCGDGGLGVDIVIGGEPHGSR